LIGKPPVHIALQNGERHAAAEQNVVVKRPDIETGAQRRPGTLAQFEDFQLANLVGQGLTRVGHIALDFRGGLGLAH
jgi:hypothetical protein